MFAVHENHVDAAAMVKILSDQCARESFHVKIELLGKFNIVQGQQPLLFLYKMPRKPLVLLKMLVASGGVRIDTSALARALWPESDDYAAKKAFDITLHRLRRMLGRKDLLDLTDGKLSIDPRQCWIDVWEFEKLVCGLEQTLSESRQQSRVPCANLATALLRVYAGHFLEHESQEAWVVACRDKLKAKFTRAVVMLAAAFEQDGKWDQAAALYLRALELDNLAEQMYRRLMICYRELGETAEALRVYRRCRELLSIVFSIQPSAATEAVRATF
jgi:DNA-binding SARP family transcriptional activator